ncbi:unnamed protein product, partial [Scytosiphon promiscuus]
MASVIRFQSRLFLMVSLAMLCLLWSHALRAQAAAPLPDYVIEQFGNPPS